MVATRRAQFGRGQVGQSPQFIQVRAAETDLNRFLDGRSLFELFNHATHAGNGAIELLAFYLPFGLLASAGL